MPHILTIQGSPRKSGNTFTMLEAVLDGARAAGSNGDIVQLGGLTIGECNGCHACWNGRECPLGDDMNSLFGKIAEADILVFGTPVYWFGPTALMKAFIDRLVWFNCPEHRTLILGKTASYVIPYEDTSHETVEPLVRMLELSFEYLELKNISGVIAPGAGENDAVRKSPEILETCRLLGAELARKA
jgi:multimeric flavodoxin WrbA